MAHFDEYLWILIVGALAAFFTAYGIGANDVANAFGTSVGARTLTLRHALLIAAFAEFGGAVLLGAHVTATVAGGIADISAFKNRPEVYMYGMLCALVSSGTWLLVATYWELPVSTTHSIVGAVIGFALAYHGSQSVRWSYRKDEFPYIGGVVAIVVSWVVSPVLTGLVAMAGFGVLRTALLRRRRSVQLSFGLLPLLVLITFFINLFFVLNKGNAKALQHMGAATAAWISAAAAGGAAVLVAALVVPYIRRRLLAEATEAATSSSFASTGDEETALPRRDLPGATGGSRMRTELYPVGENTVPFPAPHTTPTTPTAAATSDTRGDILMTKRPSSVGSIPPGTHPSVIAVYPPPEDSTEGRAAAHTLGETAGEAVGVVGGRGGADNVGVVGSGAPAVSGHGAQQAALPSPSSSPASSFNSWVRTVGKLATYGTNVDIHQVVAEDEAVRAIHSRAEVFDPMAEHSFKFLQVFTAMCVSFAHGANDVANAVGPFAAIYAIYRTSALTSSATTPTWILALGGAGIVVGLATYGYKIIRVLGVKSVAMTPSRGFVIELSTALVIVVGSRYGLPLSTTHCQVGGTLGVGMLEGFKEGVNWSLAGRFIFGWVMTLVVAGLMAAGLFAQGAYAPRA